MHTPKRFSGLWAGVAGVYLLLGSGCGSDGSNGLVRDVLLKTFNQDGDTYGEMTVSIDTGNLQLPAIDLPIWNPKYPGMDYGSVALRPVLGGGGEIAVAVNITQAAKDEIADPNLPNGRPIPIGGLDNAAIAALNVGNGRSRVYFAFGANTAVLGVAVVIDQFDQIGSRVGNVNIFPVFTLENGIVGAAGIFTGSEPSSSGIAVFTDLGSLLEKEMNQILASRPETSSSFSTSSFRVSGRTMGEVSIHSDQPGRRTRNRAFSRLWRLNRRGGMVQVR